MTQMITRCPICATSFRITEAQLKTAKGSVRCGSCLQIFKAQDHLVPQKEAPPTATAQKPVSQQASPPKTAATPAKAGAKPQPNATAKSAAPKTPAQSNPFMKVTPAAAAKAPAAPKTPAAKPAAATKAPPKPAPAAPGKEAKAPSRAAAGAPDQDLLPTFDYSSGYDELRIEKDNISTDLGQENMLVFNQGAIDEDEKDFDLADDDMLISDEMPLGGGEPKPKFSSRSLGEDLSESILELDTTWRPKEKSLFDREEKALKDDDDENKDKSDESWALSMLEEMEGDDGERYGDDFIQPSAPENDDRDGDDDRPRQDYSRASTGTFAALDDNDIEDALDEELGAELQLRNTAQEKIVALDDDDDALFGSDHTSDYEVEQEDDFYTTNRDRNALLRRIEPEPLDMGWNAGSRNLRKKLLWSGMVAAGLLLLIIQVAWLQFDDLGRKEPYRSWYAAICPLLGCEVPTMTARERIRTYNLVVRSHPEASDALMVDTILLNTAPFAQPFPDLVLSFSNVNGEVLAARKFSPQEYLAGELAGRTQMPSQQPVHLSLEIVDPGPEAVNYTAYIP